MNLEANPYIDNSTPHFFDFTPTKDSRDTFESDASPDTDYVDKKKTEMCRNWERMGACNWG